MLVSARHVHTVGASTSTCSPEVSSAEKSQQRVITLLFSQYPSDYVDSKERESGHSCSPAPRAACVIPSLPLGRLSALTPGEQRGLIWKEKSTEDGGASPQQVRAGVMTSQSDITPMSLAAIRRCLPLGKQAQGSESWPCAPRAWGGDILSKSKKAVTYETSRHTSLGPSPVSPAGPAQDS